MTQPTTFVSYGGNSLRPVVALTGWFKPISVELTKDGEALRFRYRRPFKLIRSPTGISQKFMALDKLAPDVILAFATKWGRLGGVKPRSGQNNFDFLMFEIENFPEPLAYWRDTAQQVRSLLTWIEQTRRQSLAKLDRVLEKQLNQWLMFFTHPVLVWDSVRGRYTPRLNAGGLLGAIALDLLSLAGGAGGMVACARCGEFFETGDGRRKFCDECRESEKVLLRPAWRRASARYRFDKSQARRMARERKTAHQIALLLGRDLHQIERWIKEMA